MRTLPLAVIAGRLPRVVRDLARAAGKQIEFVVTGAETEIDRVILESLSEPLGHLLRNAVMHGVESPAERQRAGKRARGRGELRAVPRGSLIEIVVADDGRGVSPEVLDKARHEGSLTEVLARPGYSTAAAVTDLAGRGVGLDAVRSYARALGGSLEVRSEPGRGTEVIQVLPLALALMGVLLFERGAAVYGVPLAAVERVVLATETFTLEGRPTLEIRGRSVPVADFAQLIEAAMLTRGSRPAAEMTAPDAAELPAAAPKVLVVEDSFTVRELQRSILEAAGYPVVTARDGRDALGALDRDPGISLVITDLEMPELDGIELTRAIRADAARSSLPIVIVTSRGSEEDQVSGIEAGADAYMAKRSFDQQALLATVERLVGS